MSPSCGIPVELGLSQIFRVMVCGGPTKLRSIHWADGRAEGLGACRGKDRHVVDESCDSLLCAVSVLSVNFFINLELYILNIFVAQVFKLRLRSLAFNQKG